MTHLFLYFLYAIISMGLGLLIAAELQGTSVFIGFIYAQLLFTGCIAVHELVFSRSWQNHTKKQLKALAHHHINLEREFRTLRTETVNILSILTAKKQPGGPTFVKNTNRRIVDNVVPLRRPGLPEDIQEKDKEGNAWYQLKIAQKKKREEEELQLKPAVVSQGKNHNPHIKYDYDQIISQSHALRFAHDATLNDIRSALRNKDLETFLQPTVSVSDRRVVHYECFTNMISPDGNIIKPSEYLEKAKDAGLLPSIDSIVFTQTLERVMADIKKIPSSWQKIFFNISKSTFQADEVFKRIETFFKVNRGLTHKMIFEFSHSDFANDPKAFIPYLTKMRGFGARFSIDNVKSLDIDIKTLATHNLAFIKISADVLNRENRRSLNDPSHPRNVKKDLDRAGITLIVEKIEDESQIPMLKELNISLAQGYLFGFPAPIEELCQKDNNTLFKAHA